MSSFSLVSGAWFSMVRLAFAAVLAAALASRAHAQTVSQGVTLDNPEWEIILTDHGYSDLALDKRPGFEGREFLSGEWAAAVHYAGGGNPSGPIWFQPDWIFPDWESNSPFMVKTPIGVANPQNPFNADGFVVLQSVINNADLEITMTYEMLDSEAGIAQGNAPASAGGAGASITSSRYIFHQTYKITNVSGQPLTNFRFFQFLHALESAVSTFDNRDYGGAFGEYHFDNTQQGQSYSFDMRSGEVVLHDDIVAFHARQMPSAWEVGYYGREGTDSHAVGKPSVGVHLSVEADALSGLDFFDPPEDRWVSGAQRFDLGTLEPGGMATIDVLLSIQTSFDVKFSGVELEFVKIGFVNGKYRIEFRELQGVPVGFILYESPELRPFSEEDWAQVPIPLIIDGSRPGVMYFEVTVDPSAPQRFYLIRPIF